jgi:hypothetical protein
MNCFRRLNPCILLILLRIAAAAPAATWYIDPQSGDDSHAGTSPEQAWKTTASVASLRFTPGDALLLKSGTRCTGALNLHGSGSHDAPVHVGQYGNGPMPAIDGNGVAAALTLSGGSHWLISDLEITNFADDHRSRDGIQLESAGGGVVSGLTLRHLHVHHVMGHDERGGGCAILLEARNTPDQKPSRFDGITIEDCIIHDVPFNGIFVCNWECRRRDAAGKLIAPITRLVIRNNLLYDVSGDAICVLTTEHALIEHNEVYRSSLGQTRGARTPSAGIWPHTSDGTSVRFNRVEGLRGTLDGLAYDVDIDCHDTLVEDNLSRNNGNGFLLICGTDDDPHLKLTRTGPTIVRNNISLDDAAQKPGAIIELVSFVRDISFENNVISVTREGKRRLLLIGGWMHGTWPENVSFQHNIFDTRGELFETAGKGIGISFRSNLWHGAFDQEINDRRALHADPDFTTEPIYDSADASVARFSAALKVGFQPFDLKQAGLLPSSSWLKEREEAARRNPPGPSVAEK